MAVLDLLVQIADSHDDRAPDDLILWCDNVRRPGLKLTLGDVRTDAARIARKEAANEALVAKLAATMADMRSLQRQADNWRAECQRLSALLVETQTQLAQRMALPALALRFGHI